MPQFKITQMFVVDAESISEAIHIWRSVPYDIVTEVNIATITASKKSEDSERPKTMAQKVVATTTALVKDAAVQAGIAEKTQICADHRVPMQKKPSKFGN